MKRRAFITSSGVTLVAGCGGSSPKPTETKVEDTFSREKTSTTEAETDSAEISIGSSEWRAEGEVAEFILANEGEVPSGDLELVVRWYDKDENFLGHDSRSLPTLHAGSSWHVTVEQTAPYEVAMFDAYVQFSSVYGEDEVPVKSILLEESSPAITGIVESEKSEEVGIEVVALVYSSGWVTHGGISSESRVPPETDWKFNLPLTSITADDVPLGDEIKIMLRVF